MGWMRLDKYLTKAADMSRSEAKQYLKKGRVAVGGTVIKKPEYKIDPETALVRVDGKECVYEEHLYLMLYKPAGVVTATKDGRDRTVLDLMDNLSRPVFPVGRLDKDTEGLLLLTDDGALAHALLSPAKHVDKCYYARLDGPVGETEQRKFAEGLDIGDEKPALPAKLEPVEEEEGFGVYITIQEGRFHQVKRMAKAVGREVRYLKRLSMGPLCLDANLKPGEYRPLTKEEKDCLLAAGGRQ